MACLRQTKAESSRRCLNSTAEKHGAEATAGVRSVLSLPGAYRWFWKAIGGPAYIKRYVEEYVKPQPGCRILDIGCGPGTVAPYFHDVEYVGFDSSAEYIAAAQRQFPGLTFVCARVSEYQPQRGHFDVALALGVVHHLDGAEAQQLFQLAHAALRPGGKLVTLDGVFAPRQSPVARYLVRHDRGKFVRDENGYVQIASQVFPTVKATVRHDLLRIPYTHIIMECVRSA
jgi:SAM-dependent methyltransferase